MKKYLAAAVVAVMVFAFAAFAASLNVNDSVLAAGDGDVTTCDGMTEQDLTVVSWGAETDTFLVSWVVFDPAGLEDCTPHDEHVIFVQVHDEDGNEVPGGRSGEVRLSDLDFSDPNRVNVDFQNPVPIEDIHEIRVVIHTKSV